MKSNELQSLLTKFFYRDEHLYFQILIQNEDSTDVVGEYTDYGEYKKAFDAIQEQIMAKNGGNNFGGKNVAIQRSLSKVA